MCVLRGDHLDDLRARDHGALDTISLIPFLDRGDNSGGVITPFVPILVGKEITGPLVNDHIVVFVPAQVDEEEPVTAFIFQDLAAGQEKLPAFADRFAKPDGLGVLPLAFLDLLVVPIFPVDRLLGNLG